MKRRDFIKRLERGGFRLVRNGRNHDVYQRGKDIETVPRHREVDEELAKSIIRKYGL